MFAQGNKDIALRALRSAADQEDAVEKHPVTPGALLPMRELLADLLLEEGQEAEALREYKTVLQVAPGRFNATAGAAKAAAKSGNAVEARSYARKLFEIAKDADTQRPDLIWARRYLAGK